jgi:hypothetical protein
MMGNGADITLQLSCAALWLLFILGLGSDIRFHFLKDGWWCEKESFNTFPQNRRVFSASKRGNEGKEIKGQVSGELLTGHGNGLSFPQQPDHSADGQNQAEGEKAAGDQIAVGRTFRSGQKPLITQNIDHCQDAEGQAHTQNGQTRFLKRRRTFHSVKRQSVTICSGSFLRADADIISAGIFTP